MRLTTRLLATAKYLSPGAPTGLTGVLTHSAPRSTLLYLYNSTLDKLKQFPEHSVYRQSIEALTKHRLSIVESVKPDGYEQWQQRVREIVDANPQAFRQVASISDSNVLNYVFKEQFIQGVMTEEYNDEPVQKAEPEGPRLAAEKAHHGTAFSRDIKAESAKIPKIEAEPRLTMEQVETVEQQIGAGLIEEVILMAEGEHNLVDTMLKNEVWADLIESPPEGQWAYHEIARHDTHVPKTQAS